MDPVTFIAGAVSNILSAGLNIIGIKKQTEAINEAQKPDWLDYRDFKDNNLTYLLLGSFVLVIVFVVVMAAIIKKK